MTYGKGIGPLWGGEPLTPGSLVAEVGGDYVVFDFTDEPDGPLPQNQWAFYILDTDAGALVSVSDEIAPSSFFKIEGSKALFDYTQTPPNPGVAVPFSEQGYAAGPQGVLVGANSKLDVIFASPSELLDDTQDEFVFELTVGLRFLRSDFSFVGAKLESLWAGGDWTEPAKVSVVSASGMAASNLVSDSEEPGTNPVGIWGTLTDAEMSIELVNDLLTVSVNGVMQASANVSESGPAQVVLLVKAYNRTGSTITALPSLLGLRMKSLRNQDNLGPNSEILGNLDVFENYGPPTIMLPVPDLMEKRFIKQVGSRQFEFTDDVVVSVEYGSPVAFDTGDVVRSTEKYVAQTFVPVVRDLPETRARSQRK